GAGASGLWQPARNDQSLGTPSNHRRCEKGASVGNLVLIVTEETGMCGPLFYQHEQKPVSMREPASVGGSRRRPSGVRISLCCLTKPRREGSTAGWSSRWGMEDRMRLPVVLLLLGGVCGCTGLRRDPAFEGMAAKQVSTRATPGTTATWARPD